jgi:hypothetical protein
VSYLNDGSRRWPNLDAAKAEVRAALGWGLMPPLNNS